MLNPTSPGHLVNAEGQPYFLWDSEMTLEQFRAGLRDPDPEVRAYLAGKLMRQAKPDDVFTFLSAREIRQLWLPFPGACGRDRGEPAVRDGERGTKRGSDRASGSLTTEFMAGERARDRSPALSCRAQTSSRSPGRATRA
jgi:hypothetical protein